MNLIALLAALLIERLATQLFHLRQLRWLDAVIDAGFRQARRFADTPAMFTVLVLVLLLVLPLLIVLVLFDDLLYGFVYLCLAIIILFFSFGPRDIGEQVDDYCAALSAGDETEVRRTAKALLEREVPEDPTQRVRQVEAAVCVQANNRLFAIIFWFVALGPLGPLAPLGAWVYRVTDLIRRRAVFNAARCDEAEGAEQERRLAFADAASHLHGWLVWIPARLTALGFALAGSFEAAIAAWRQPATGPERNSREESEDLLARVGVAAMALTPVDGETPEQRGVRGASAANGMVFRLLGIWAVVIAAMTLYGWSL